MIAIVGSGIAGTAAALTLRAANEEVVVIRGAAGASMLAPGVLDGELHEGSQKVLDALGLYTIGDAIVATTYAILRSARGTDRALLDVGRVKGTILVPDLEREGWDGPVLARGLGESAIAKARGLAFASLPVQLLLQTSERMLPDADIAARNDDPARIGQLAERIRAVLGSHAAVLLPPWLGIDAPRADALSKAVGVPCGEIATPPASPAGFRFARARDRALERSGALAVEGFADALEKDGDTLVVRLEGNSIRASHVVVATGGVVAGGIHYVPGEASLSTALPRTPRPVFAPSLKGAGVLGWDGQPMVVPGSLFGIPPESLAWPHRDPAPLERVGFLRDVSPSNVVVAGDARADAPRTFLGALRSGIEAALSLSL